MKKQTDFGLLSRNTKSCNTMGISFNILDENYSSLDFGTLTNYQCHNKTEIFSDEKKKDITKSLLLYIFLSESYQRICITKMREKTKKEKIWSPKNSRHLQRKKK